MATRILGLDIGARFVRGVVLESQGRNVRLVQLIEEPIEHIEAPLDAPTDAVHTSDASAPTQPPPLSQADDGASSVDPAHADTRADAITPAVLPSADANAEHTSDDAQIDSAQTDSAQTGDAEADGENSADEGDDAHTIVDPIDERAWDDATRSTVERILHRADFEIDWLIAAAPEGSFMFTTIELPFNADREVRAVLGPQLEDRLPGDDQDLHLDYMVAGKGANDEQWRMYAGGLAQREMAQFMAQWQSIDADPRIVDVAPFPLFTTGEWLAPSTDRTVAYIDIGAHFTRIIISSNGVLEMARTIPGGGESIVDAIAEEFGVSKEHARTFSAAPATETEESDEVARLNAALQKGLRATARDLRRTLTAHASRAERSVGNIYVSGTAFDLPALPQYMSESLGMTVDVLRFDREEVNTIPNAHGVSHRFATALGLALRANPPEHHSGFNLRNGDWAFRGAYAYITQRLPSIMLLVGGLLFSVLFFLIARNALFKAEFRAADDGLAEISSQVFGVEVRDPNLVKNRLSRGVDGFGLHPDISAYEVMARISQAAQSTVDQRMPIVMDNVDADMGRRQVRISGVCESANAAETFGRELGKDNCLQSVQRTNLSQRRSDSKFEFSYTASVNCRAPESEDDDDASEDADAADTENVDNDDADSEEAQ